MNRVNKIFSLVTVALMGSLSSVAHAQDDMDDLLSVLPPDEELVPSKESQKSITSAVGDDSADSTSKDSADSIGASQNTNDIAAGIKRHQINLSLGTAYEEYKTTGSGTTVSLVRTRSKLYWGWGYAYKFASNPFAISAQVKRWATRYNSIPVVVPNAAQVVTYLGDLTAQYWVQNNKLAITFGYFYQNRKVDETTPNVLPTYTRHGPSVGIIYQTDIHRDWHFAVSTSVSVPIVYKETSLSSGSHIFTFIPMAEVGLYYDVSNYVQLGFTPWFRYERTRFEGLSSRLITNTNETNTIFTIPLSLKIHWGGRDEK